MALAVPLQEFNAGVRNVVARIETRAVISALFEAFERLGETAAARRENASQDWLAERTAKLGAAGREPQER